MSLPTSPSKLKVDKEGILRLMMVDGLPIYPMKDLRRMWLQLAEGNVVVPYRNVDSSKVVEDTWEVYHITVTKKVYPAVPLNTDEEQPNVEDTKLVQLEDTQPRHELRAEITSYREKILPLWQTDISSGESHGSHPAHCHPGPVVAGPHDQSQETLHQQDPVLVHSLCILQQAGEDDGSNPLPEYGGQKNHQLQCV